MKKFLFLLPFLVVTGTAVLAQSTITLTFTGRDQNNAHVRLDNVTIQNLTRGWTEAIFFPDTVYTLTIGTGISDYADGNEMQVMPNPFDGRTQLNLCLAQGESVRMMIVDITGKKCAEYNGRLSEGDNIFEIMLTTPQTYILSVQTSEGMHSVKMVNTGRAGANQISLVGGESNTTKVKISSTRSHVFELGDEMRYTGYSHQSTGLIPSTPVIQQQYVSEEITLHFDLASDALPCPGTSTVTDYDGNVYNTVQIGNQCWMKENLRTTHYSNGTSIALGSSTSTTTAYRYYPDNSSSNVSTYGYLYNWKAVMRNSSSSSSNPSGVRGICPTGWHVPSDAEWTQLTNYVSSQTQYQCNNSSSYIAKALASTIGWNSSTETCAVGNNPSTNNATGFSALPAGGYGNYYNVFGGIANFWSATEYNGLDDFAYFRYLYYIDASVYRDFIVKGYGFSVRCVRDSLSGGETTETIPTVITNSVSNITATNATCGGNVTSDGGATVTARGVCWSTSQNPTINSSYLTIDGSGTGFFTSSITGLTAGTTYYVRAYAMNSVGTAYGDQVIFTATSSPTGQDGHPCPGAATVTDVDGNVYNTVKIGNQCWMKENLRTTRYADGVNIPMGSTHSYTDPYRYAPDNNSSNVSTYGYLYNWPAVMHVASSSTANPSGVQGICPNGWHVPSDAEWTQLTNYVGSQTQYQCDNSSYNIAKALASTTGWWNSSNICAVGNNPSTNNATGFSVLPAGYFGGGYYGFGGTTTFWSATGYSDLASYLRDLDYEDAGVLQYETAGPNSVGNSVRCIRN